MCSFLNKAFFWRKSKAIVAAPQDRPGPTPWYSKPGEGFSTSKQDYCWKRDSDKSGSGLTKLVNSNGRVVLILDFYCYVRSISEGRLLLWQEQAQKAGEVKHSRLQFQILELDDLKEFENVVLAAKHMREEKTGIAIAVGSGLVAEFCTNVLTEGRHVIATPSEFDECGEVLAMADYGEALVRSDYHGSMRRAIYAVNFSSRCTDVYPQDWFNNSDMDFGYQWITRVWRRQDGRIEGDGNRINPFILDPTCKQLEKR